MLWRAKQLWRFPQKPIRRDQQRVAPGNAQALDNQAKSGTHRYEYLSLLEKHGQPTRETIARPTHPTASR
jgi:hypothetical protein